MEERRAAKKAKKQLQFDQKTEDNEECDFEPDEEDNDDAACIYCNDVYSRSKPGETWLKCNKCCLWAHNECAGLSKRAKNFICELCKN